MTEFTRRVEARLDGWRRHERPPTPEGIDALLAALDAGTTARA